MDTTALTVVQRAALALGATEHETALRALAVKHAAIHEITNDAGRDDCHSAYMELKNARVDLEKRGKTAREDAIAFGKAVINEERRLAAIVEGEEERLKQLRDGWDQAREAERLAEAQKEVRRVEALQARITDIRGIPAAAVGKSSTELESIIEATRGRMSGVDFEEFRVEAEDALRTTLAQLSVMVTGVKAQEDDAQRIAEERAELARLRAADQERQAKEAAERAERQRAEDEQRRAAIAVEEKRLAEQREAQDKAEAEARAQRAEDERRLALERAEVAREKAALEQRRRDAETAAAAIDAKVRAAAPIFHRAMVALREIVKPDTPEHEIVERAFTEAGLSLSTTARN